MYFYFNDTLYLVLFFFCLYFLHQLTITLLVEIIQPSQSALLMPSAYDPYVEIYCANSPVTFLIPLSFNIVILVICTLVGFITRKLPENFNESWFIFLSAATTLFSWAVFVPAYFTTVNAYLQSAILGCCLILNRMITLGCLFGPILYAFAFVPNDPIKLVVTNMSIIAVSAIEA